KHVRDDRERRRLTEQVGRVVKQRRWIATFSVELLEDGGYFELVRSDLALDLDQVGRPLLAQLPDETPQVLRRLYPGYCHAQSLQTSLFEVALRHSPARPTAGSARWPSSLS